MDSKLTHKERILKLLSFVEKKNTIMYINFVQALEDETNHPGHQMLAEMLSRATGKFSADLALDILNRISVDTRTDHVEFSDVLQMIFYIK